MGPRLSCRLLLTACAFSLALPQATAKPQSEIPLHSVQGPDVTLHYVSVGRGQPVVTVHGGLEDYRAWTAHLAPHASSHYRAVAYSRHYNFPNRNETRAAPSYSAQVDADDLAMLIERLHLGPVHLVGHSYGGLAALLFATEHPELVRSLTLSEPPVFSWVEDNPAGAAPEQDFFGPCWVPFSRALPRLKGRLSLLIASTSLPGNPVILPALPYP